MGRVLLIACTNVGRYMTEEIVNNPEIKSELVGIVNLNANRAASKANYDSYSDLAIKYDLPIFYCNNVNDSECMDFIRSKNPDLIIQTGWSQKFHEELLNLPKYGCIGEHPAPLPKGRGAACVNWAILTGEKEWGDTFFRMVEEYDKGQIYSQSFFNIEEYDDVFTVYEKVATVAAECVSKNIDNWTNGIFHPLEQDNALATYYKRRTPDDGIIKDFSIPAKTLHDFIRAQTHPYPGAFFIRNSEKISVLSSECIKEETTSYIPGTICSIGDGSVTIACENGEMIKLKRLQREGKPSCWADDFAKEAGIVVGQQLLSTDNKSPF